LARSRNTKYSWYRKYPRKQEECQPVLARKAPPPALSAFLDICLLTQTRYRGLYCETCLALRVKAGGLQKPLAEILNKKRPPNGGIIKV
jgi:hypothetical protein